MVDTATLSAEDLATVTRPLELGVELGERVTGTAKINYLFGIPIGSKVISLSAPVYGSIASLGGGVEQTACATILMNNPDADGLFVLRSFIRLKGFRPFFWSSTAEIEAITVDIVELGMLSEERADRIRMSPERLNESPRGTPFIPEFMGL
jgi:hypothetical protein